MSYVVNNCAISMYAVPNCFGSINSCSDNRCSQIKVKTPNNSDVVIIDTAGTITKSAQLMMDNGASSVRAFCTHPVLSELAYDRLVNSPFTEIVVTDTIPLKRQHEKFTVLSTADLFAEVIRRIDSKQSISSLFQF